MERSFICESGLFYYWSEYKCGCGEGMMEGRICLHLRFILLDPDIPTLIDYKTSFL